jgi:hypothetical protein
MGSFVSLVEKKEECKCKKKYILYTEGYPSKEMVNAFLDIWYASGNKESLMIIPREFGILEVIQ